MFLFLREWRIFKKKDLIDDYEDELEKVQCFGNDFQNP